MLKRQMLADGRLDAELAAKNRWAKPTPEDRQLDGLNALELGTSEVTSSVMSGGGGQLPGGGRPSNRAHCAQADKLASQSPGLMPDLGRGAKAKVGNGFNAMIQTVIRDRGQILDKIEQNQVQYCIQISKYSRHRLISPPWTSHFWAY